MKDERELLEDKLKRDIDIALEDNHTDKAAQLIHLLDDLNSLPKESFYNDTVLNVTKTMKLPSIACIPLFWLKRFAFTLQKEAYKNKNMQAGIDAGEISGMILELEGFIEDVIDNNPDLDLGDYE